MTKPTKQPKDRARATLERLRLAHLQTRSARRAYSDAEKISQLEPEKKIVPTAQWIGEVSRLLQEAELFSVCPKVLELVLSAASADGSEELRVFEEDLLAPAGLMFFEKPVYLPIEVWDRSTGKVGSKDYPVYAIGYRRQRLGAAPGGGVEAGDGIFQAFWSAGRTNELRSYAHFFRAVRFGGVFVEPTLIDLFFLALLRFASQRIVQVEKPGRKGSTEMRKGKADPETTRRIILRRAHRRSSSSAGEGSIEYQHRWLVKGHWRLQWFPSRKRHETIWIAPYVKGPEDKPFVEKSVLFDVSR